MRMRRGQRAATAASWVTMTIVRPAAWSVSKRGQDVRGRFAVQVAGRFVGEHQVGLVHQRAGDGHALLLAAGELGRRVGDADRRGRPAPARAGPGRGCRRDPSRRAAAPRSRARWSAAAGGRPGRRSRSARCAARPAPGRSASTPRVRRSDSARHRVDRAGRARSSASTCPIPTRPAIATSSPRPIARLTPRSAWTTGAPPFWYRFVMSSSSIIAIAHAPSCPPIATSSPSARPSTISP